MVVGHGRRTRSAHEKGGAETACGLFKSLAAFRVPSRAAARLGDESGWPRRADIFFALRTERAEAMSTVRF